MQSTRPSAGHTARLRTPREPTQQRKRRECLLLHLLYICWNRRLVNICLLPAGEHPATKMAPRLGQSPCLHGTGDLSTLTLLPVTDPLRFAQNKTKQSGASLRTQRPQSATDRGRRLPDRVLTKTHLEGNSPFNADTFCRRICNWTAVHPLPSRTQGHAPTLTEKVDVGGAPFRHDPHYLGGRGISRTRHAGLL